MLSTMTTRAITVRFPNDLAEMLETAKQRTKRTDSSIIRECVEKRLPSLIGRKKTTGTKN